MLRLYGATSSGWARDVPGAFGLALEAHWPEGCSRLRAQQLVELLAHAHGAIAEAQHERRERDDAKRRAEQARRPRGGKRGRR